MTIQCSDRGSEFDAVTDEGFTTQLTFAQRFSNALKENTDRKVVQPRLSDEPPPRWIADHTGRKTTTNRVNRRTRDQ